ncbi:protein kinase domain-containing protein [Desulfopila inferna]|uniref:protein kinase domain-containing protein n=1 Tax=Desulfopila inferna TaxID=468528 RepID=UPI0019666807|nr:protein kinase [Desulfopila inferna]MBM9604020.1 protein kinase [Desulfopila inferna]
MRTIGKYIVQGRIGRGGMSSVYKARAPITARTVAIKILQPRDDIFIELVGEEGLRKIFLEEARLMGEISHDHVAKILDCDENDGSPFIVLEYFAHSIGSLIGETYLLEEPSRVISLNKAYRYIRQALHGLERLHFAGIIHRDIKPYNLMITNDDRIKIIDFGLSRVRGEEKTAIPGLQVGSPYYAAPEQEKEPKNADERADLFSVGIMAYRLVTGRLVSHKQHISPPSSFNPDLDSEWDDFLLKSISRDTRQRFQSALEMRQHLDELYTGWVRRSKKDCTYMAQDPVKTQPIPRSLRSRPVFILHKQLQKEFDLDSLMRPKNYSSHRFEIRDNNLLACLDTGQLWQRQGAGFPLTWNKAHEYIDYLNSRQWQGYTHWRLPTTEELGSLLRPPTSMRDFCFASYFSQDIHWLWSSDTCTRQKAWVVDIQESYFQELDKDGMAAVCGVVSK